MDNLYLHWKSPIAESDGNPLKLEHGLAYLVSLYQGRLKLHTGGNNISYGEESGPVHDYLQKWRPHIIGVISYSATKLMRNSQSPASSKVQFSPCGNRKYVPKETPVVSVINNQAYADIGSTITLINKKTKKEEITLRVPKLEL